MSLHESTDGRRHEKPGDGDSGVSAIAGGQRSPLRRRADSPHGSASATGGESEEATSDVGIESPDRPTTDRPDGRQFRPTVVRIVASADETDSGDQTGGSTVRSVGRCAEMQSRVGRQPNGDRESYVGYSLSEIAVSHARRVRGPDSSGDRTETDPCVAQASGYLADGR